MWRAAFLSVRISGQQEAYAKGRIHRFLALPFGSVFILIPSHTLSFLFNFMSFWLHVSSPHPCSLCAEAAATTTALRALHPAQAQPAVDWASLPLADEVPVDVVSKALRSFPADTAPGPSGLRVQHLREAGHPGNLQAVTEHLTSLVRGRRAGPLPPSWPGPAW